jgi:Lipid A 3-O-deacylase (PagL)
VPWIVASIAPGGSDLNIGKVANDSRLTGPFLALIQLGAGVSYFVTDRTDFYLGFQAQHVSNGGFNGRSLGASRNIALNTPWNGVVGVSWFFH